MTAEWTLAAIAYNLTRMARTASQNEITELERPHEHLGIEAQSSYDTDSSGTGAVPGSDLRALVHARVREEEPGRVHRRSYRSGALRGHLTVAYHVIVHPGFVEDSTPSNKHQIAVDVPQDVNLRRGADLLLARKDVDPKRLAYGCNTKMGQAGGGCPHVSDTGLDEVG